MSVPPPGPPKKEPNANVTIALIGALGTVAAASIPIISSVVKAERAPAPGPTPAAITKSAAAPASAPPANMDNEIPADALADRTSYTITLSPYKRDPGAPDTYTAVQDAYFRSPKDRNKWIRLTITQHDHNQTVTLAASDFDDRNDTTDISAKKVREDEKERVETKNFKLTVAVVEVKTGPDTDPTAPLSGNVFEKLLLRISCEDKT